MLEAIWALKIQEVAPLGVALPNWVWPAMCAGSSLPVFDPNTEFLSSCLLSLCEVIVSLLCILPILAETYKLAGQERGKATVRGRLAGLCALIAPVLRLTILFQDKSSGAGSDYFVVATGFAAALLHQVQEGRVLVCSSELLLYWLGIGLTSAGLAVDAFLNFSPSWQLSAAVAVLSIFAFTLEYLNDRVEGVIGYDTVNVFEKVSLNFMSPLLKAGAERQLTRSDFPEPTKGLTSYNVYHKMNEIFETYSPDSKYRVILSVLWLLKSQILSIVVIDSVAEALTYLRPLALAWFLKALRDFYNGEVPIFHAAYFGILAGVLPIVTTALQNIIQLINAYTYVVSRSSLTGMIYRKALRLSPRGREAFDAAKIMNLINVDSDQVETGLNFLPNLVSAPIALIISTWQLYFFIGKSMFAAIPLYVLFVPYSSYMSKFLFVLFPEIMKVKDQRTKATSNALRNIKSVKLYAWEEPLAARIDNIRENEIGIVRRTQTISAMLGGVWSTMSDFVAAAVFVAFLYFKQGELLPEVVFPVLALLINLTAPFALIPMSITSLGQAFTSQKRINELLSEEDQKSTNLLRLPGEDGYENDTVKFDNALVSWNGDFDEEKIALKDLRWNASNGELICITGRVGSGKTAMLKALCGELKVINGSVVVRGTIAYCPQEAWLQNKTVKENVLFGLKYDEDFYLRTIKACDLEKDVASLPKGHDTDVGERGISLSGGQKARVALARAIYSRADVYVLDDVLSAVDEHVSAHLIDNLLGRDGIIASKTIILATNNVKVLSHASKIIALRDKSIVEQGTLGEVRENKEKSEIYRLIKEFGTGGNIDNVALHDRKKHISSRAASDHKRPELDYSKPSLLKDQEDEEQDTGSVSWKLFARYFRAGGYWTLAGAIIVIILSVLVMNMLTIWLGMLSNHGFSNLFDAKFYVIVYLVLAFVSAFLIFFSSFWTMSILALRAATVIHNEMVRTTLHAKMTIFDTTPLGRMLNRFTGDIQNLDSKLPYAVYYMFRSLLNSIQAAIIVLFGAPLVIIVVLPMTLLSNMYRKMYVPASRQISRMSSAANSPILAHIEESIKGASIIRSYGFTEQFVDNFDYRTDYWIETTFLKMNSRRWLTWRIQAMTAILGLCASLTMVILIYKGLLSVGFVGVVMHNTNRLGIMVQQTIFFFAELEICGVSLERAIEYIDAPQEAAAHIPETKPTESWPSAGIVKFENFSTRYKTDGDDVLKNLNFSIQSKEKIGIVGRTGSGKSTLTLSLFRLLEASEGRIEIDAIDTATLGLTDLRSRLSIIPQDAQIFEGTLRENLDPLNSVDDTRLWQVLELCHLKEHFSKIETGLETPLVDGGDNISRGQAQLICLGRALVHESRLLVLDEATASVDVETDRILQQTIRTQFKDRTIITIAHRLNTIMDSDKIMVLDGGVLKEFDTPENLLKSKGFFWSLHEAMMKDPDHSI